MLNRRSLLLAGLLSPALPFAQEKAAVVLLGFPIRRSKNLLGQNETEQLSDKDSKEFLCMITAAPGGFLWSSRGSKPMTRHSSGPFVVFAAVDGSGYVKVFTEGDNLEINYMEHFHDKLFTFTYWGKSTVRR